MSGVPSGESLRLLEHEVGVLVRRLRRVLSERARAVHPDLQPGPYLLLALLAERGPSRASTMVEAFDLDKAAVSRQLQHLVELGLAERAPDPADGRATLVAATGDAVRRMAEVADRRRERLGERLSGWDDDQVLDLARALGRYNAALGRPAQPDSSAEPVADR